jgi:putative colanic acid biosynthesis UDP-glucose lipid carrier transferase
VLYGLDGTVSVEKNSVYIWLIVSYVLVCSTRVAIRLVLRFARAAGYDLRRVGFLGANDMSLRLVDTFKNHPWMGMNVIGVFDTRPAKEQQQPKTQTGEQVGDLDALVDLANCGEVDIVYISQSFADEKQIKDLIERFADSTVSIYFCPSFFNFELINARWDNVFGQPVVSIIDTPFNGHRGLAKMLEDVFLLLLLGPFVFIALLIVSLMILIASGRPVFFKQVRYGLDGKAFVMWKFRTMHQAACKEQYSQATSDDQRVTWFGALLRKTSLDELPQYLNVLRGDMSFVGPRPHPDVVNDELRKSIHRYMFRHKIKPGITGLAQVNGCRGETKTIEHMENRLKHDLRYIKNWSLWLDIKILFETLFVFAGRNVY